MKRCTSYFFFALTLANSYADSALAAEFVAYSLRAAEKRFAHSSQRSPELVTFGGITHLAGMVYDNQNDDWIIVGQAVDGHPPVTLDDFIVAMRAVFVRNKSPLVSIDATTETESTHQQIVRFEGGVENTQLGKDMLEADVLLKKIALGRLRTDIWGVRSYSSLRSERAQRQGTEDRIASRFWFKNVKPSLAIREGVFAMMKLDVGIETEVLYAEKDGQRVENAGEFKDEIGDIFVQQLEVNLDELANAFPILKRTRPILALVSLAQGMQMMQGNSDLKFWLHNYHVPKVETAKYFELIEDEHKINGRDMVLKISGGLELNPILVRLKKGHVSALRDVVLNSRPSLDALIWHPSLQGWHVPGVDDIEDSLSPSSNLKESSGFSIEASLIKQGQSGSSIAKPFSGYFTPPISASLSKIVSYENPPPWSNLSPNIGGVMLSGAAKIAGSDEAKVDLASGNFSLIVEGQSARLAPETFRQLVTALWSVYYSKEDPGISIDPIAPRAKKHLVRYIGRVINTDLGRVMREADYVMKKWSVGTERADITGFKSPDDYAATMGTRYVDVWSRFWFVPEDMRFKRAGDMLLFDDGRMTLKTEYLFQEGASRSDPSNEKFAQFFTERYSEIAVKYPVYQELFEYAKIVSLVKYLKDNDVPLYWFLMANKDLVMTEDSPSTVDAFAKASDYFEGIHIEGGVELKSKGIYIYDQAAANAIKEAYAKLPAAKWSTTSLSSKEKVAYASPESFSFDLGKNSYTVVPQHSLTSGKDRRGIRYQTDLAIRAEGFRLTDQTVDYFYDKIHDYETKKWLKQEMESLGLRPPYDEDQLTILENKASKQAEEKVSKICDNLRRLINLDYKTEQELGLAIDAVVGRELSTEQRAFILQQGHYRTDLELVRYYNPKRKEQGEFGDGWHLLIPYKIAPADTAKVPFLNVIIPKRMALENLLSGEKEVLTFSTNRYSIAGYVPDSLKVSQIVGLFLLSDASYRLADKLGNEFTFDPAGYLTDMTFSEDHHFSFEYLDGFTDAFEQTPYKIQPVNDEQVAFLNVRLPKYMEVADLINGTKETLTFNDSGRIAGYVPKNPENSRYQILALLSDASFQLLDKEDNEIAFDRGGGFERMAISSERRMINSVSQGQYVVNFKYTIDNGGTIQIASAYLSKKGEDEAKPQYVVHYNYDAEGRLCQIIGPGSQFAGIR